MAFDRHRGADVVPAGQVFQHVGHKVAVADMVPQMMVGVDDGQVRLERIFLLQCQPLRAHGQVRRGGRCWVWS